MINWFDMPAEGLSGGGQFEIKELSATKNGTFEKAGEVYNKVTVNVPQPTGKITITENGTDINISQYAKADVNVSGGGGGDFSTAQVTIVNNASNQFELAFPNIYEGTMYPVLDSEDIDGSVVEVVLYKGVCDVYFRTESPKTSFTFTATGDVEGSSDDDIVVRGNGSLTIADA